MIDAVKYQLGNDMLWNINLSVNGNDRCCEISTYNQWMAMIDAVKYQLIISEWQW